jgi:hypothetical protein
MKDNKTVTINGISYDAATGLPMAKIKSQINNAKAPLQKTRRSMDIARSKSISHFAPIHSRKLIKPIPTNRQMDAQTIKHPIIKSVEKTKQQTANLTPKPTIKKSSRQIKEEAIAESLNQTADNNVKDKRKFRKYVNFINIFSVGIVLVFIAGCLTYLYMPSFSVRIASVQAGINASYPQYHPDGYSLNGPILYSDGEVSMTFHANTGDSEFVLKESKSSWDSSAVRDMVNKDSKGEFIVTPTEVHGLSIYTYGSNAAWVNGGILYTIKGNIKLSNDQIRRIAASL